MAVFSAAQGWKRILEFPEKSTNWFNDYNRSLSEGVIAQPRWFLQTNTGEVLVHDDRLSGIYRVNIQQERAALWCNLWSRQHQQFTTFASVFDTLLFLGVNTLDDDTIVVLGNSGDPELHRGLVNGFDKQNAFLIENDTYLTSMPVYFPVDRNIWMAIWALPDIYVVNLQGQVIDSLTIESEKYRPVVPRASQVRTPAVIADWLDKWTQVTEFRFVYPDKLLLQFRCDWQPLGLDSIPLFTTLVIDKEKNVEELQIDPRFRLAGVMDDGEVIFAHWDKDADDKFCIRLYFGKIER